MQHNNGAASTLLRRLFTIVFMLWLATVVIQYDENSLSKKPEITTKQPLSNIVIEQLTLPPIPTSVAIHKPQQKQQTITKLAEQPAKPVTKMLKHPSKTPPVNTLRVENVYEKLSDEGVDIQIAWPRSADKRQAALHFMYQCVGVQFAVLNGSTLHKINHPKINQPRLNQAGDYSDWVRVAQGSLSKNEHNWLNAYALTGTPIRLFPRHIDWRLAQYVAKALQGVPLISLRARYQISKQRLQLIDIYINNQQITDSWILFQGKC